MRNETLKLVGLVKTLQNELIKLKAKNAETINLLIDN